MLVIVQVKILGNNWGCVLWRCLSLRWDAGSGVLWSKLVRLAGCSYHGDLFLVLEEIEDVVITELGLHDRRGQGGAGVTCLASLNWERSGDAPREVEKHEQMRRHHGTGRQ